MGVERQRLGRPALAWAFAATLAPAAAAARDMNPQGIPVGHRALGMGGAYTAVAGDGVGIWYNPASLGGLASQGLSASATLYQYRTQTIENFADFRDGPGGDPALADDLESQDFNSIPSSLVYSMPLGDPQSPVRHGIAAGLFVPDEDRFSASAGVRAYNPETTFAANFQARTSRDEQSYWLGAGYGVDLGEASLGISAFAVAHFWKEQFIVSIFGGPSGTSQGGLVTGDYQATDVTAVLQAGLLYEVSPRLTVGLNLRSPGLARLYDSGEVLVINASGGDGTGAGAFIDRHEVDDARAEQRQPIRATGGLAWRPRDSLLITADVGFIAPIGRYEYFDAPAQVPRGPDGQPLALPEAEFDERTLTVARTRERRLAVNGAVGLEATLTPAFRLRAGAYSDFSTIDELTSDEPFDYRINIFSGVLSMGYSGERGSTDVGLIVRKGSGKTRNDQFAGGQALDVEILTAAVFLAGSTDL